MTSAPKGSVAVDSNPVP